MIRRVSVAAAGLLLAILMAGPAAAGQSRIFVKNGYAIRGYDPVAYFTDKRPIRGEAMYSYEWKGATWLFTSREHLAAFTANPEKYAPKYGGYCAYGVAQGAAVPTDPVAWDIVEGKLYMNLSLAIQKKWRARRDDYIREGDRNWPGVLE